MPLDGRQLARALRKKGFVEQSDRAHIWYHHTLDGVHTGLSTCLSHSKTKMKDIDDSLAKKIQRQLELDTKRQLEDLVNCPMSAEDYVAHLREKRIID